MESAFCESVRTRARQLTALARVILRLDIWEIQGGLRFLDQNRTVQSYQHFEAASTATPGLSLKPSLIRMCSRAFKKTSTLFR
jgi:hypothetical protein